MNGKWDLEGIAEAAKIILNEENPLFQSLTGKLAEYKGVRKLIYRLLFQGEKIVYNPDDPEIGILKNAWISEGSRWKYMYKPDL